MNTLVKQETSLALQIEQVMVSGDLKTLTADQRVAYYNRVCESIGLNPYTRPFEYLQLNGKLTLYPRRDATDQLRSIHGISLSKPHIEYVDDLIVVTVEAINRQGRTDTDLGAVNAKGLEGEAKANAIMKAITKAKRRVTLSLAGLGWLDDSEVDSVPGAQRVMVDSNTGEILDPEPNTDVDFGMGEQPKPVLSKNQLQELNILGRQYYGAEWDTQRPRLVKHITKNKSTSSKELTPEQADKLINGLRKQVQEAEAAAMAAPSIHEEAVQEAELEPVAPF